MWFKNIKIFRLDPQFSLNAQALHDKLSPMAFNPGQFSANPLNLGWTPIFPENEVLVHAVGQHYFINLRAEKKLLPVSVINQFSREKAIEVEEQQGYRVGRKQMRELKEQVADSLRPRAFSIFRDTGVWFDMENHFLVVNAGTASKSDEVIALLAKCLDPLPVHSFITELSPVVAMSNWLSTNENPAGFTIDQDTELKSMADDRASVRYSRHSPDPEDLAKQLGSGKVCTRLALTWNDRISFVLNDAMDIKRITPLDILSEHREMPIEDEIERFDADMTLMCAELHGLVTDLAAVLGGEKSA